jgi:autophagy-related protein 11
MLEVEDWTQPSHNKRRVSSKKASSNDLAESKEPVLGSSPPSALPPGPPEAEVEESFQVTHPPNSHLFPVRNRTNSSPAGRPSSLSRLLAQATPETQLEPVPQSPIPSPTKTLSPTTSPPPPPSPSIPFASAPQYGPVIPSPLRPGSRASRMSATSKFSVGRAPALAGGVTGSPIPKAAPTTALTEQALVSSSPSSGEGNPFGLSSTPSPDGSISDGMANALINRRRTTSYHIPRASPLAGVSVGPSNPIQPAKQAMTATSTLANLANSWGVSFSRKKAELLESDSLPSRPSSPKNWRHTFDDHPNNDASAAELLKRF